MQDLGASNSGKFPYIILDGGEDVREAIRSDAVRLL